MYRSALALSLSLFLLSGCATLIQNSSGFDSTESENAAVSELSVAENIRSGDESARSNDYNSAQIKYALAVEQEPDNTEALYKLAFVHKLRESLDVAESLLHHLLSIDPGHQQAGLLLANVFLQLEKFDDAESVYKKIIVDNFRSAEAHNGLGVISDLRADHVEAQQYFSLALSIEPRSAKYSNNLGYSLYLEGKYNEAESNFQYALNHDSNYSRAWSNLALLYSRTDRLVEADAAFRKIVSDHQAANNLGYLGFIDGDRQAALDHLTRAIEISPSYYDRANQNLKLIR